MEGQRSISAMQDFTPLSALAGGMLIGLSATLLWVVNGRTAGISNIFGGLYPVHRGEILWRLAFLVGLPLGGWLGWRFAPAVFAEVPTTLPAVDLGTGGLIVAGLLVGAGTRIGRGCTSGHGICGLARFSKRSAAAVATFMATGIATVFIMRHVL
jgi:uncharacterized membrane protein YedE/YeeE